jgi:hypothetical protein
MALADHSARQLREQMTIWRRRIIAGVIVFVLGCCALNYLMSGLRVLLEDSFGVASGRLLLAALLVLSIVVTGAVVWMLEHNGSRNEAKERSNARFAALMDAVNLGYNLAQDLKAAVGGKREARKAPSAEEKRAKKERAEAKRAAAAPNATDVPL